jgi:prepilin-type N-terminal cleavage/methylation domain-containing protein
MRGGERRQREDTGGFTLLELIVSLAILALIAGSVTVGIRLASASIERGEAVAREAARLRAAVGILERAILSLDPLPVPGGDNPTLYFSGEEKRIRFLTSLPPAALRARGPRLISFFELPGPAGGLALAHAAPFRVEGAGSWEGTGDPLLLIRGATEISFTYSEGPAQEGNWEWLATWDPKERGRLPAAVRLEFTAPTESGPRKSAFVVPIPAGGGFGG